MVDTQDLQPHIGVVLLILLGLVLLLQRLSLVEADMFRLVFTIAYKNVGSNFI